MNNDIQTIIKDRLSSIKRDGIGELVKYLEEKTDYFTAPASTKFHSNFEGGLAEHSHNVVELFKEKNERFLLGLSDETIYIVGYLHDLCKCNIYSKGMRLTKDPLTNKWIAFETYVTEDLVPLGHGEKSQKKNVLSMSTMNLWGRKQRVRCDIAMDELYEAIRSELHEYTIRGIEPDYEFIAEELEISTDYVENVAEDIRSNNPV